MTDLNKKLLELISQERTINEISDISIIVISCSVFEVINEIVLSLSLGLNIFWYFIFPS